MDTTSRRRRGRLHELLSRELISVAGLQHRAVSSAAGEPIGKIVDVMVRWDGSEHPPLTGLVLKVGQRRVFVGIERVAELTPTSARLSVNTLDLQEFSRREGEMLLMSDVVDRQLVDVDGVRVIRASDLYLGRSPGGWLLMGADVSMASLARRLGPASKRSQVTPERVIDWASIQPFGRPGQPLMMNASARTLRRLRPSELADLLEELDARNRQQLLETLDPEVGADVVEELSDDDAADLLSSLPLDSAANLLRLMDPDEATDALQHVDEASRQALLQALPASSREELVPLLRHEPHVAGGMMTTRIVTVGERSTVAEVMDQLRVFEAANGDNLPYVLVVDDSGALVDDVTVLALALADPGTPMRALVAEPYPVTVPVTADLDEIVSSLRDNRGSSLIVLDEAEHPLGRIDADDVIDAMAAEGRGILWKASR